MAKLKRSVSKKVPVALATKLHLNTEVIYVDPSGKERHARVVSGDSETVNLVVTMDDPIQPIQHISDVQRGRGSKPHTWHPK